MGSFLSFLSLFRFLFGYRLGNGLARGILILDLVSAILTYEWCAHGNMACQTWGIALEKKPLLHCLLAHTNHVFVSRQRIVGFASSQSLNNNVSTCRHILKSLAGLVRVAACRSAHSLPFAGTRAFGHSPTGVLQIASCTWKKIIPSSACAVSGGVDDLRCHGHV